MGYTVIHKTTRQVAVVRSRRCVGPSHWDTARDTTPFEYACPECGDGSNVPTTCLRCDVELHPTASTVEIPRRSDADDETHGSLAFAAIMLFAAFGIPAVLWLIALHFDGAVHVPGLSPSVTGAIAIAIGGPLALLGPVAAYYRFARMRRAARRRAVCSTAREHANTVEMTTATLAPDNSRAPVRIRGHVEIEEGRLYVKDDDSRVSVPITQQVRVFVGDVEAHALSAGQAVEVVGIGARKLGAGDGYRDVLGEFAFDATQPIDVFVG